MNKLHFGIVLITCFPFVSSGANLAVKDDTLIWQNADSRLVISLQSPEIYLKSAAPIQSLKTVSISGDLNSGKPVEIRFSPVKLADNDQLLIKQYVQYFPKEKVIRKWAMFKLEGETQAILNEVVYDKYESKLLIMAPVGRPPQSFPVFIKGFFAGIEFPVASTRVESATAMIAFRPGEKLPRQWYTGRTAIYGITETGKEKTTFLKYISNHRPQPRDFHLNYCSWWSAPILYSEKNMIELMDEFKEHLYKPYGISFDSFAIDMGWSDAKTIWKINNGFPDGFSNIKKLANSMNSNLALWISPTNCYSPNAIDSQWAQNSGYETFKSGNFHLCCIAGPKYHAAYNESLIEIAKKYKIHHLKSDGYFLECPDANHGHEPGMYSSDKIAENGIKSFQALREVVPDIWIEATCFSNASPWWLFYVNSTIGCFGDDSPPGRVPCPVYRQSYTTARDFHNLIGSQTYLAPIEAQEVLGLIHQTREDFTDDAVVTFLRGNAFVPLYIDPMYMNAQRWKSLASLIKWAKSNNPLFENTTSLLPVDWKRTGVPDVTGAMPRQVYGYAHGSKDKSIVLLRNPWIQVSDYNLTFDSSIGLGKNAEYSIESIYPQPRLYIAKAGFGSTVKITLAPYETIVLSVSTNRANKNLAQADSVIGNKVFISQSNIDSKQVEYDPAPQAMENDRLNLADKCNNAAEITAATKFDLKASAGKLLVLCESDSPEIDAICKIQLNGKEVRVYSDGTSTGWRATWLPNPENWLFFWAPVEKGTYDANILVLARNKNVRVSGWIWAYTTENQKDDTQLPKPELVSLDSAKFMDVIDCNKIKADTVRKALPVTKINGIYLDAVKDISGSFKRNLSDNNSLLSIKGIRYTRGLGTAIGKISVPLKAEKYSKFKATVGLNSANGTDYIDKAQIVFIIRTDGKEIWKSRPLMVWDQPEIADVNISGAKVLELETVQNESKGRRCVNLADWVDAALIYK